jgi:hypothetical protein
MEPPPVLDFQGYFVRSLGGAPKTANATESKAKPGDSKPANVHFIIHHDGTEDV